MRQAERGQGWEHGELKHGHTSAWKTHAFHTAFLSRVRVFYLYFCEEGWGVVFFSPTLFRVKNGTCVAHAVGAVELRPWSSPKPHRASTRVHSKESSSSGPHSPPLQTNQEHFLDLSHLEMLKLENMEQL